MVVITWAGQAGNPLLTALGVDPSSGNLEQGLRFGIAASSLFAVITTAASCPVR